MSERKEAKYKAILPYFSLLYASSLFILGFYVGINVKIGIYLSAIFVIFIFGLDYIFEKESKKDD